MEKNIGVYEIRISLEDWRNKMKFNKGDRVFHRRLERYGIYVDDDWASVDSCFVKFDNEDDPDDVLCHNNISRSTVQRKLIRSVF